MDSSDIDQRFRTHAVGGDVAGRMNEIRRGARELAHLVNSLMPDSREKSLAVTKLEEAVFWSSASLARSERVS